MKKYLPIIGAIFFLLLFFGSIYTELALVTFDLGRYGPLTSPIVWLISGLVTSGAAFYFLKHREKEVDAIAPNQRLLKKGLVWAIFLGGSLFCGHHLAAIFAKFPIGEMSSDIVPSLEIYVKRLLSGIRVYQPIEFHNWVVHPTYLPLMWLPYIFSELLEIDYRWTAYAVFVLAIALYNIRMLRQSFPFWEVGLKALLPFLMLVQFIFHTEKVLGFAVELMPIGFYLILSLTLFSRSNWIMAIGILLCLLSRYAFTFWLPVYLIVLWAERGFPTVFKVGMYTVLGVALLYILPFLSKDWGAFSKGLAYYDKTALDQWYPQAWQEEGTAPYHLARGLSFAYRFYEYEAYAIPDRLSFNRKVHVAASLVTALFLLLGYFFLRKRQIDPRWYLIIGLKLYLTVFYSLLFVPFHYLYMLPMFMSIPLIYYLPLHRILVRKT